MSSNFGLRAKRCPKRQAVGLSGDIDPSKSSFLFVTTTGILPFQDNGKSRRNVRSHVTRNFLDSNKLAKTDIQLSVRPLHQDGKKLRFRLKPGELEIIVPQRSRHHSPATRSQKCSPEAEVSTSPCRSVRLHRGAARLQASCSFQARLEDSSVNQEYHRAVHTNSSSGSISGTFSSPQSPK